MNAETKVSQLGASTVSGDGEAEFKRVISFDIQSGAPILDVELATAVREELALQRVSIDAAGLTEGMKHCAFKPIRRVVADYCAVRTPFDSWLAKYEPQIRAVKQKDEAIQEAAAERDEKERSAKEEFDLSEMNKRLSDELERSKTLEIERRERNGGRKAVTFGRYWFYFVLLVSIGGAEWLINYDTFYSFFQVPAVAAGATLVLGALLAFSAHEHGKLLKQWSYYFGKHQDEIERNNSVRMLAFATFGLMIVLAAAGGSRFEAANRITGAAGHFNILGAEAIVEQNIVRDVLLSLLANVAAWALGVFLAYNSHDTDPIYMGAAVSHRSHRRTMDRREKREIEPVRRSSWGTYRKRVEEEEKRVRTITRDYERPIHLWRKVREREQLLLTALNGLAHRNADQYRSALVRSAALSGVGLTFPAPDRTLSCDEYERGPLRVDRPTLEAWLS